METSDITLALENFTLENDFNLFHDKAKNTHIQDVRINDIIINKYTNEFWTSKQRQSNSIHEVSYRACFKPQLPNFFIEKLTEKDDIVYDPFLGRGTTAIEAGLRGRNIIGNDINPLSKIFTEGRLHIPDTNKLFNYLNNLELNEEVNDHHDLDMFFHEETLNEILNLRNYILRKEKDNDLNHLDKWVRMVATNRLTGHSKGFFSVYTMPPNQAVSRKRQIKINEKRQQKPEYKNIRKIIFKKSKSLLRDINQQDMSNLKKAYTKSIFLNNDASRTKEIEHNQVKLIITSPPFLDIVQYSKDNWLRLWFNGIDFEDLDKKITMSKTLADWSTKMQDVFHEFYRILKPGGFVAFEVGEIKNGKIKLDEYVLPLGIKANLNPICIIINQQEFTKTANIWGVSNNKTGTNSNRIILFQKQKL